MGTMIWLGKKLIKKKEKYIFFNDIEEIMVFIVYSDNITIKHINYVEFSIICKKDSKFYRKSKR